MEFHWNFLIFITKGNHNLMFPGSQAGPLDVGQGHIFTSAGLSIRAACHLGDPLLCPLGCRGIRVHHSSSLSPAAAVLLK